MSLKAQECVKKYWAMVIGDCPLPMRCRLWLYIAGAMIGFLFLLSLLYFSSLQYKGNPTFQSALAVFFLTFPLVTINWFIKNRDISRQLGDSSQQLKDSSQQLEYSLQQQNETLFSNSLQLLFKENDKIANSIGLKELVQLKQEGRIASDRIGLITSSGLQIKGASLENANLRKANLQGANLQGSYLKGAFLVEANLQKIDLQKAFLKEANLQSADLLVANLQEANLQGANLLKANLLGAKLQRANLRCADLQSADLRCADLQGADIQGAKLQEADLRKVNLQKAKLELSLYNEMTRFPDGFDPKQHRMKLVQMQNERESDNKY